VLNAYREGLLDEEEFVAVETSDSAPVVVVPGSDCGSSSASASLSSSTASASSPVLPPSAPLSSSPIQPPASLDSVRLCKGCHQRLRVRGLPPLFCKATDFDFGVLPPELQALTRIEWRMVSLTVPVCTGVHLLPLDAGKEGEKGPLDVSYMRGHMRGHAVNFANDVTGITRKLPRHVESADAMGLFVTVGQGTTKNLFDSKWVDSHSFSVKRVRSALVWLKKNNVLYRDVEIDDAYLSAVPDSLNTDVAGGSAPLDAALASDGT
jgi:hypothetical protein